MGLLTTAALERSRWDRPVANLQVNGTALSMTLHSYDPHLVIANDTDMIRFVFELSPVVSMVDIAKRLGLVPAQEVESLLQR